MRKNTCNVQTESVAENMAPTAADIKYTLNVQSCKTKSIWKTQGDLVDNHLGNLVAEGCYTYLLKGKITPTKFKETAIRFQKYDKI